jgi:hypothetical protein
MKMITRTNADYNKVSKTSSRRFGSGHSRVIRYTWSFCFGFRAWSENGFYAARSFYFPQGESFLINGVSS